MEVAKVYDSILWKNMNKTWPLFENMVVWSIGNGESIDILKYCWVCNTLGKLIYQIIYVVNNFEGYLINIKIRY